MGPNTAFLLSVVMGGVFLYALFFVIRAGVAAGIQQALPSALLRAPAPPPYSSGAAGPDGEQV